MDWRRAPAADGRIGRNDKGAVLHDSARLKRLWTRAPRAHLLLSRRPSSCGPGPTRHFHAILRAHRPANHQREIVQAKFSVISSCCARISSPIRTCRGHHSGDEPPKIGFALTLRQGPPATVSSVGGLWCSVALGGDRSAGAGTVQCDFFCSVGLENAQTTPHFSGATSCSNSPTFQAADPLTLFGPRTLDWSCGFYVHAVFY